MLNSESAFFVAFSPWDLAILCRIDPDVRLLDEAVLLADPSLGRD